MRIFVFLFSLLLLVYFTLKWSRAPGESEDPALSQQSKVKHAAHGLSDERCHFEGDAVPLPRRVALIAHDFQCVYLFLGYPRCCRGCVAVNSYCPVMASLHRAVSRRVCVACSGASLCPCSRANTSIES